MESGVCTLYEGHYQYGVGTLINSLYTNGFRGDIFIGYKGALPFWVSNCSLSEEFNCSEKVNIMVIGEKTRIIFIEIAIKKHFAHYKPEFMLKIMQDFCPKVELLAYFDPDIVLKCNWKFYERWSNYGVSMVHEIVSQDMTPNHPSRKAWEEIINNSGNKIERNLFSYLNCGFCGVNRKYEEFLLMWSDYINLAINQYGQDETVFANMDRTATFWSIDQDTFNMTAMSCKSPISEMGPEGMDFIEAGWTMSHATGSPKPWKKNFILSAIDGRPPTRAEKEYWNYTTDVIKLYSESYITRKKYAIKTASFIGRFYRR